MTSLDKWVCRASLACALVTEASLGREENASPNGLAQRVLPVAKWVGGAGIHGSIDYHHPTAVALTSVGGLEIDGYHQAAGNRLPITLGRLEAPTLHRVHGGAIEIAGAAALVQ